MADGDTLGWYARFAALAGLVAVFGLSAKAKALPLVTAALAAMGFLDALSSAVSATDQGWALTVIVVLNALQAVAAVAALLMGPDTRSDSTAAGYEAYVDYYNQAVRNYYSQQSRPSPSEQSQRSGYGQAYGDAQATAPQSPRAQRSSQQADYSELDYGGGLGATAREHHSGGSAAGRPSALPSFGQAATSADRPHHDSGESAPPSSPA